MTDQELAAFLCIAGDPDEHTIIARLTPKARAAYEALKTLEEDIVLWQQGVGPKPTNAILCHDHSKSNTRGES
jgi:hypothetical protein